MVANIVIYRGYMLHHRYSRALMFVTNHLNTTCIFCMTIELLDSMEITSYDILLTYETSFNYRTL